MTFAIRTSVKFFKIHLSRTKQVKFQSSFRAMKRLRIIWSTHLRNLQISIIWALKCISLWRLRNQIFKMKLNMTFTWATLRNLSSSSPCIWTQLKKRTWALLAIRNGLNLSMIRLPKKPSILSSHLLASWVLALKRASKPPCILTLHQLINFLRNLTKTLKQHRIMMNLILRGLRNTKIHLATHNLKIPRVKSRFLLMDSNSKTNSQPPLQEKLIFLIYLKKKSRCNYS